MTSQEPLTIDIVSDVVCPWCYLGKVQLEEAIRLYGAPVITRWHPFQLDPTIPQGGVDRKAYMAKKFPDPSYLKEAHERLIALGIQRGLNFRFENIEKSPNTLDAHRLIYWAGLEGRQSEIVTMLFKAYFEEGFDIGILTGSQTSPQHQEWTGTRSISASPQRSTAIPLRSNMRKPRGSA